MSARKTQRHIPLLVVSDLSEEFQMNSGIGGWRRHLFRANLSLLANYFRQSETLLKLDSASGITAMFLYGSSIFIKSANL